MQRGQHGRGGQSTKVQPSDALTPVLPPLYPTAPSPAPMPQNSAVNEALEIRKRMTKYFLSNYNVTQIKEKYKSAFAVERYSDRYNSPSISNLHVVHRAKSNRYPAELSAKDIRLSKKSRKIFIAKRLKRSSTEVEGNEDKEKDSDDDEVNPNKSRKTDVSTLATDDEDEEDVDEEMDVGNDYMVDHFDNGEDFQDNDALDAGGCGDGDDGHFY